MRRYRYVGPEEVRASVAGAPAGHPVRSVAELERALVELGADAHEPCTYVVTLELDVLGANPNAFHGRDGTHLRPVPPRRCSASPRRPGPQLGPVALRDPCQDLRLAHLMLRIAERRSEHVACAAGQEVLAAGEIAFAREGSAWRASEVSNQSTGYCPEPSAWPAVARALEAAGIAHAGAFSHEFVFRRCERCGERNVVKDAFFECDICGAPLPGEWNLDPDEPVE